MLLSLRAFKTLSRGKKVRSEIVSKAGRREETQYKKGRGDDG